MGPDDHQGKRKAARAARRIREIPVSTREEGGRGALCLHSRDSTPGTWVDVLLRPGDTGVLGEGRFRTPPFRGDVGSRGPRSRPSPLGGPGTSGGSVWSLARAVPPPSPTHLNRFPADLPTDTDAQTTTCRGRESKTDPSFFFRPSKLGWGERRRTLATSSFLTSIAVNSGLSTYDFQFECQKSLPEGRLTLSPRATVPARRWGRTGEVHVKCSAENRKHLKSLPRGPTTEQGRGVEVPWRGRTRGGNKTDTDQLWSQTGTLGRDTQG